MRKGMRTATWIAQWAIAQRELGDEMTLEDAQRWWKENERTWYRRLADFREVFPGAATPAPLAALLLAENPGVGKVADAMASLGSLTVPADFVAA